MANDNSVARNKPEPSTNIKELRIEGERTAAMWANGVRVSRIDMRLRDLAASTSAEGRKLHRLADTAYNQAISVFEDALSQIEKDLELNSRRNKSTTPPNRRPQQQPQRVKQGQVETGSAPKGGKAEVVTLPTPMPTTANQTTKSEQNPKSEGPVAKPNAQTVNPPKVNSQQPQRGQAQKNSGQQQPQKQTAQNNSGQQGFTKVQPKQPQQAQPQRPPKPKPNNQVQAQVAQTPATA